MEVPSHGLSWMHPGLAGLFLGAKAPQIHRITGYSQLEGTPKDHQAQALAYHRTTGRIAMCLKALSKHLNSGRLWQLWAEGCPAPALHHHIPFQPLGPAWGCGSWTAWCAGTVQPLCQLRRAPHGSTGRACLPKQRLCPVSWSLQALCPSLLLTPVLIAVPTFSSTGVDLKPVSLPNLCGTRQRESACPWI